MGAMRKRQADEPRLFDLPLAPAEDDERESEPAVVAEAAEAPAERAHGERSPAEPESLPLFGDDPEPSPSSRSAARPAEPEPSEPEPADADWPGDRMAEDEGAPPRPRLVPRRPMPAPFAARLVAALVDFGVHAAVAGAGWLGTFLLGARIDAADLPAVAVFLLSFSFLYAVVSLAFWGRTPGMAAAGVVSRGPGNHPLTFGQTGLRWLAGVLTAVLAGLPLLLALTGRSLPDRLSGSTTLQYR